MIHLSWGWAPFLAIALSAVANTALIMAVGRVRPQAVAERPYLDSFHQDERQAAKVRFTDAGLRLRCEPASDGIVARIDGDAAALAEVSLECYRPADRGLDRRLAWPRPGEPLVVTLPAAGRWVMRLGGRIDGEAVEADADAEAGGGDAGHDH